MSETKTSEQLVLKHVIDAVVALNRALDNASTVGLHIELETSNIIGRANPNYIITKSETRTRILP